MSETRPNISNAGYYEGLDYEQSDHLGGIDAWLEIYDAYTWIEEHRVADDHVLDVQATAKRLKVPIVFDTGFIPSMAQIRGIGEQRGIEPLEIILSAKPGDKKLPFGHEAGHLFLDRETTVDQPGGGRDKRVEDFCEMFGRSLVIPLSELSEIAQPADEALVIELMEQYEADHHTVLVQLMLAGKIPRAIAFDTGIGEVPNPYYSQKVRRHTVCLDCELGKPHVPYEADSLPLYDFTDYEWSDDTPNAECAIRPSDEQHERHRALNISYGRWTEADEAMHESEKVRAPEMRAQLAQSMRDDGLSEEWVSSQLPK